MITPCEGIPAGEAIRDRLAAMQSGTIALGFWVAIQNEPAAMRGGPMFEFVFNIECLFDVNKVAATNLSWCSLIKR